MKMKEVYFYVENDNIVDSIFHYVKNGKLNQYDMFHLDCVYADRYCKYTHKTADCIYHICEYINDAAILKKQHTLSYWIPWNEIDRKIRQNLKKISKTDKSLSKDSILDDLHIKDKHKDSNKHNSMMTPTFTRSITIVGQKIIKNDTKLIDEFNK